jgi:hypothetical protein
MINATSPVAPPTVDAATYQWFRAAIAAVVHAIPPFGG